MKHFLTRIASLIFQLYEVGGMGWNEGIEGMEGRLKDSKSSVVKEFQLSSQMNKDVTRPDRLRIGWSVNMIRLCLVVMLC